MSPRRGGWLDGLLPSGGAFGVVQSWLTTAATGAVRSVSWNSPWNIWFTACAAGVGAAAANALVMPAVSGTAAAVLAAVLTGATPAGLGAATGAAKAARSNGAPVAWATLSVPGLTVAPAALAACVARTASLRATS